MDDTVNERQDMAWNAWGSPTEAKPLSPDMQALIAAMFGTPPATVPPSHAVAPSSARLRDSALTTQRSQGLAALVGKSNVLTDKDSRLLHAGGKSTLDLLRRRSPQVQDAPDAVVLPADHDEVLAVLEYCAAQGIAVVPFGGGTSVVGGLDPNRGGFDAVVTLDLRRLTSLTDVDFESGTATLGAGLTGPQAEELLGRHGLSLGHYPQSFQFASIGGFAATRSCGQASQGYGGFDDMIMRLRVATPRGTIVVGRAPVSAAGPDLRELFSGSEGTLGVITSVTLRVHEKPERVEHGAWSFPDFATGVAALRAVSQTGCAPTMMRMSDEAETAMNLAITAEVGGSPVTSGCLVVAMFEGTADHVAARLAEADAVLRASGGTALGPEPARAWEHGRFSLPYLRDALLDVGVLSETLETATDWSNLLTLRSAMTDALTAALPAPALVLCHISHTYPTGASLYFTVAAAQGPEPLALWGSVKRAVSDAIMANGGTISHHHAVGVDHRAWMPDEIGDLGIEILRAAKRVVDPKGILNPGKLVPEEPK